MFNTNVSGEEFDKLTIEEYSELKEKCLLCERRIHLMRLLKGGYSYPQNAIDVGKSCEIEFPDGCFAVLCMNIDDLSSLFFESDIIHDEKNLSTAFFIITNVIQDTVGKICQCWMTPTDSWMAFILSVGDCPGETDFISRLRDMTQAAVKFIDGSFGLKVSAIISTVHEGIRGISEAYTEAAALREYKRFLGLDKRIMYFGDYYLKAADIDEIMQESNNSNHEFTLTLQFLKSVRNGDYIGAKQIMSRLVYSRFFASPPAVQTVPHTYYGLNHIFFLAIEEIRIHSDRNIVMILRPDERLSTELPIEKIQQNMENLFDYLIEYKTNPSQNTPPKWLYDLAEYIEKNYTDVNINITTAAERFNLNPAYASRKFKQQYGTGIMERTNELRIEKAKKLIAMGETIAGTANLVGYGSAITMRRAFKRYEGCTPSMLNMNTSVI